jgi:hypothetical protein
VLDIRDQNGARTAFNNNWRDTQAAQITATGRAPPLIAAVLLKSQTDSSP